MTITVAVQGMHTNKQFLERISADTLEIIDSRCGDKCEFPGCKKDFDLYFHHITKNVLLVPNIDVPSNIMVLCGRHHRMAHDQYKKFWELFLNSTKG